MARAAVIPLASDTASQPSDAMRAAIAAAAVGDEQMGEDPTVNRLLERVCTLLEREAALFLPSGTMCNLVALKTHTQPGDVVLVERDAHIVRAETGGAALAAGVQFEALAGRAGRFSAADLRTAHARLCMAPAIYAPPARLLCVEQTHNYAGGTVWSLAELEAVAAQARRLDLALHIDGARLFNAAVASATPVAAFARCADSVWIDFTKGLGAPLGAVLAGTTEFIARARRYKHVFGGAMRQAGIVAAGCLHALDHHVERLAEDHANARALASGLAALEGVEVHTPQPESNIVLFTVTGASAGPAPFLTRLRERGVKMSAVGERVRAVTHLDVSAGDVERAVTAVATLVEGG